MKKPIFDPKKISAFCDYEAEDLFRLREVAECDDHAFMMVDAFQMSKMTQDWLNKYLNALEGCGKLDIPEGHPNSYLNLKKRFGAFLKQCRKCNKVFRSHSDDNHYCFAHKKTDPVLEKLGRNEICKCGSGLKFKKMLSYQTSKREIMDPLKQDFVILPKKITAENGAKALLIGEFKEIVKIECPECALDGRENPDDCEMCEGSGVYSIETFVSWDNIKKIYDKIVDHFYKENK